MNYRITKSFHNTSKKHQSYENSKPVSINHRSRTIIFFKLFQKRPRRLLNKLIETINPELVKELLPFAFALKARRSTGILLLRH